MINTKTGNLLKVKRGLIVHGCNAVGVMGTGVALQVRNKWPAAQSAYRAFLQGFLTPHGALGKICWHPLPPDQGTEPPVLAIAHAITQVEPGHRRMVSYEAIATCFEQVSSLARGLNLPVHFPLIGCGLAGGDWGIVSTIIDRTLHHSVPRTLWTL